MSTGARPSSLKVGHLTYVVSWRSEKWWLKHEDPEKAGSSWASNCWINMRLQNNGQPIHESNLKETLLHEILHTVWHQANMAGHGTIKDDELEEWVVGSMSMPLISVLQENPDVVEYLSAGTLSAGG